MTISATYTPAQASGNGVTVAFPFTFKTFEQADLVVIITDADDVDTTQTITTHYTVSLNADQNNNPGGTVTMLTAPVSGTTLTIARVIDALQETDIANGGGFYPEVLEDALDRLTMLSQQNSDAIDRSFSLPVTVAGVNTELPVPAANNIVGWNATADALQNYDPSVFATVVSFGTAKADIFDGDGVTLNFTLTANPGAQNNLDVSISGVTQTPGIDYTWSAGTTISFVVAPPVGTDNVLVRYMQGLANTNAQDAAYTPAGAGAVETTIKAKLRDWLSVKDFGAVGDGVADDGAALNLALARLRTLITSSSSVVELDLAGGRYRTTISLNATGLVSWGWKITNGTIIGECAGKCVLDMVGSRGGSLENIVIDGDQTDMPYSGIQCARNATYQFCDNMLFDNVSIVGWFEAAALHIYGQETTTYDHCRFWNYNPDGHAAALTGYSALTMTSDYLTPITGSTSYINNNYDNCDFRYIPIGKSATVTGISKAATAVVTAAAGHPFVNGETVTLTQVNGMTEINNAVAVVANATATTFELTAVNSSGYSVYTSGGLVAKVQTVPTVYFTRGSQHHFNTCYIVAYGHPSMVLDHADPTAYDHNSIWIDSLFEGAGSTSHVKFTSITTDRNFFDFKLKCYSTHCSTSLMATDDAGGFSVRLFSADVSMTDNFVGTPTLIDSANNFGMYDTDVFVPTTGNFDPIPMGINFVGSVAYSSGIRRNFNSLYSYYDDGAYTPIVTPQTGAITAYTATGTKRRIGNLVFFTATVNITTNGTGATALNISLPATSASAAAFAGRENAISGAGLQGLVAAGTAVCITYKYDNTYPGANGAVIYISGCFEVA